MSLHILLMTHQIPLFIPINAHANNEGWFVENTTSATSATEALAQKKVAGVIWDLDSATLAETTTFITQFRSQLNGPIMLLTADKNKVDIGALFDLHIDDFLTEPFNYPTIFAILKHRLWLYQQLNPVISEDKTTNDTSVDNTVTYENLSIDLNQYKVYKNKLDLGLTAKEFQLLIYLMKHQNNVLSREQLLEGVWGYDIIGTSRMVDIHISHLRDKIEDDPKQPQLIQTARGFGYIFKNTTPIDQKILNFK